MKVGRYTLISNRFGDDLAFSRFNEV